MTVLSDIISIANEVGVNALLTLKGKPIADWSQELRKNTASTMVETDLGSDYSKSYDERKEFLLAKASAYLKQIREEPQNATLRLVNADAVLETVLVISMALSSKDTVYQTNPY